MARKTYVIYGKLDGTTCGVFTADNVSALRVAEKSGEQKLLEFKSDSWKQAKEIKDGVQRLISTTYNHGWWVRDRLGRLPLE